MPTENQLSVLLEKWEELRTQGQELTPEELCRERPDLVPELQQKIQAIKAMEERFRDSQSTEDYDTPSFTPRPAPSDFPQFAGRYRLQYEIARGGMGAVLRAVDPDFDRPLAVKIILAEPGTRPDFERRFFEEARITGRLQHPGIAPVHEMGRLDDGRPFFAMKLIEGQTLSVLLRNRATRAEKSPDGEPTKHIDLPRFLAIFEQISQTLAYAHKNGIIHRDLKPANIMVGEFGEVQVMDWGLAKRQKDEGEGMKYDEGGIYPSSFALHPSETEPGVAMGTPAFMAPEQARGEISELDERCDVFGLGAILCVMLTGKPPYIGETRDEVKSMARKGDVTRAFAELDCCNADIGLIALCKRCLAPQKAVRPRDAGEVADAVSAYLEGMQAKLRQAELEKAQAEVQVVEERRRRRRTLVMALALLAAAGVAASWFIAWQIDRSLVRRDVNYALQQAESNVRKGGFTAANEFLRQAKGRLGAAGPDDLRRRHDGLQSGLLLANKLEEIRLSRSMLYKGDFDYGLAWQKYQDAFAEAEMNLAEGDLQKLADQIRGSLLKSPLLAAVDDCIVIQHYLYRDENESFKKTKLQQQRQRLLELARRVDPQSALRAKICNPSVWEEPEELQDLADNLDLAPTSPQLLILLGELLPEEEREKLWRAGVDHHPDDFFLHFDLGFLLDHKAPHDSKSYYETALALRPKTAAIHNNLGSYWSGQKDFQRSIAAYRRAIQLKPDYVEAHSNLAGVLLRAGQVKAAIASAKRAIDLDPEFEGSYIALGVALRDSDKEEAVKLFEKALSIKPSYAHAHFNLANIYELDGQLKKAVDHYRKAMQPQVARSTEHIHGFGSPGTDKASTYIRIGIILQKFKDHKAAAKAFDEALRIAPDNATAHTLRALALEYTGRRDEAMKHCREAIRLEPNADAHYFLANGLQAEGDYFGAIEHYQKAIKLLPKYADAHVNLAVRLRQAGDVDGAIKHYREAIKIKGAHLNDAYYNLGIALRNKGKLKAAVASLRAAIEVNPKDAMAYRNMGVAFELMENWDEAIKQYRESVRINPQYKRGLLNLGRALKQQGDFVKSLEALKRANGGREDVPEVRRAKRLVELDQKLPKVRAGQIKPADVDEWLGIAAVFYFKKLYAESAEFYREALKSPAKIEPGEHRYNAALSALLAAGDRGKVSNPLTPKDKFELRQQALTWLQAELKAEKELLKRKPLHALKLQERVTHWQKAPKLASVREGKHLTELSKPERQAWRDFWTETHQILQQARASFLELQLNGTIGDPKREETHALIFHAGKTYVIEMHSQYFNGYVRLQDGSEKKVAFRKIHNAHIAFAPKKNGAYQIVAAAHQQRGRGPYTITIREFAAASPE